MAKNSNIKLTTKMKRAREAYGLNYVNMSRICGFGINQWRLYETGQAEPNQSHKYVIRFATEPIGMFQLLELCSAGTIDDMGGWKVKAKCLAKVKIMVQDIEKKTEKYKDELRQNYFEEDRYIKSQPLNKVTLK